VAVRFLAEGIWKEITAAARARRRGKAFVAVPYFGKAGSRLLPLREGDTLLVNAGDAAVRSGQTNPRGLRELLNKGVQLYSLGNLHAKIYVIGSVAFIGSVNASAHSSDVLEEAVVRIRDPKVVREAREHIQNLPKELLVHRDLDRLENLYRPPRRPGGGQKGSASRRSPRTRYFIAQVNDDDIDQECTEALVEGHRQAKARRERRNTEVEEFWRNGDMPYRTGDIVIQVFKTKYTRWIYPPGKVIHRRVEHRRNGFTTIVYLETPKRSRRRLSTVQKLLARRDRGRIEKDGLVGNNEFRSSLLNALG
jgi:hypothetical protein